MSGPIDRPQGRGDLAAQHVELADGRARPDQDKTGAPARAGTPEQHEADLAVAALRRRRAELAAQLEYLSRQTVPIRADIFHLDAAIAILRGRNAPRMRAQHRPEWFADLGRLVLDILRGAPEPMTARAVAVEVMRLAGHDIGNRVAVEIVTHRVRASLTRRVGVVERVAVGRRGKGWRVVEPARQ